MTDFWSERAEAYAESNTHREGRDLDLFVCVDSSGNPTLPPSVCGGTTLGTTLNDENGYTAALGVPSR